MTSVSAFGRASWLASELRSHACLGELGTHAVSPTPQGSPCSPVFVGSLGTTILQLRV